jgi:hypothetical protein
MDTNGHEWGKDAEPVENAGEIFFAPLGVLGASAFNFLIQVHSSPFVVKFSA